MRNVNTHHGLYALSLVLCYDQRFTHAALRHFGGIICNAWPLYIGECRSPQEANTNKHVVNTSTCIVPCRQFHSQYDYYLPLIYGRRTSRIEQVEQLPCSSHYCLMYVEGGIRTPSIWVGWCSRAFVYQRIAFNGAPHARLRRPL